MSSFVVALVTDGVSAPSVTRTEAENSDVLRALSVAVATTLASTAEAAGTKEAVCVVPASAASRMSKPRKTCPSWPPASARKNSIRSG